MFTQVKIVSFFMAVVFLLVSCKNEEKQQPAAPATDNAAQPVAATPHTITSTSGKGPVAAHLVCMVNDAYMGKEQIPVPLNGKTYYGCCEMCKNRIPQDATVRRAKDPQTGKTVDKATAFIAVTGDNGSVSYFENEGNYKKFTGKE